MKLKRRSWQYLVVALFLIAFLLLYYRYPPFKMAVSKASQILAQGRVELLRDYLLSYGFWAPLISALLMVFQSVVAPLPAFVITFANGLLFGMWWGAALSWSSSMIGAAVCFYLARLFGRPLVERIVGEASLEFADSFFKRYGKYAVFLARLIPVISFDVISYASGLTAMGFWEFFIATGLGQLPATLVYSYLGQSLTGTIRIIFWAFVIVIAFLVVGVALRSYLLGSPVEER
jgi:uncharacterized membrane protein YdjX (TVP38/TMEM64 family)